MATTKRAGSPNAIGAAISAAFLLAAPVVMKWEGKVNTPYRDIVGVETVCYGHTGSDIQQRRYSDEECRALLFKDYAKHATGVATCTPGIVPRTATFAFATSVAFNIGVQRYCASTAAIRFNSGNFQGGCDALGLFRKAGGKVSKGLVNRRAEEVQLCKGVGK